MLLLNQSVENIMILSTTDMLLLHRVGVIAPKIAVVFHFSVCLLTCYQSQSVFLSQGAQGMQDTSRLLTRVSCLMTTVENSVRQSYKADIRISKPFLSDSREHQVSQKC